MHSADVVLQGNMKLSLKQNMHLLRIASFYACILVLKVITLSFQFFVLYF